MKEAQLACYYKRLFPVDDICSWLAYGNDAGLESDEKNGRYCLAKREIGYLFADGKAYRRFQSFNAASDLLESLMKDTPSAINIGACYNQPCRNKGTLSGCAAMAKELVIDFDLTSYPTRICCSTVCGKCWPLMSATIEVVDEVLRETYGFELILWVYSGRRGVHCWVCDPKACMLDNHGRTNLLESLNLFPVHRVVLTEHDQHPLVQQMIERLRPRFEERLKSQNLFADKRIAGHLLSVVPDEKIRASIAGCDPKDAWNELQRRVLDESTSKKRLRFAMDAIVVEEIGPRPDSDVTKNLAHLLKCPFSPHPDTGQISVPFDPRKPFDPLKVPTVSQLIDEIDAGRKETSLEPYLEYFRTVFLQETVFPSVLKGVGKVQPRIIRFIDEKRNK